MVESTLMMRREILNLVRPSNRVVNEVRCSESETVAHRLAKQAVCDWLAKEGKHFVTEAIFKDGSGRVDVLCLDTGVCYEIVCSEKEESLARKSLVYPKGLRLEVIKVAND